MELCAFEKQIKFGVSCKHLHLKNMVICHQHYKLKYLVLYHIIFCTKTKMANSGNCSVLYLKKKKHPASAAFLSHKILSKQTFFCVCVKSPLLALSLPFLGKFLGKCKTAFDGVSVFELLCLM